MIEKNKFQVLFKKLKISYWEDFYDYTDKTCLLMI